MTKSPERFDFSKLEDQQKFDKLPEEAKTKIISESQEEANVLKEKIESGEAGDFNEASHEFDQEARKEEIKQEFVKRFSDGMHYARELSKDFALLQEVFSSPELQDIVRQEIVNCAQKEFASYMNAHHEGDDKLYYASEIQKEFGLSEEFIKPITEEAFVRHLSRGDIYGGVNISERFFLPETFVQESAQKELINSLTNGGFRNATEIKKGFSLQEEFMNSSEVKSAAKEGFTKILFDIKQAIQIKTTFSLSEEFTRDAAKRALEQFFQEQDLSSRDIEAASKVKSELLPKELGNYPELQHIIEQKLVKLLSDGNTEEAVKIITCFNLSVDSSEIQSAAKNDFIEELSQGVLLRCHKDSLSAANKIKDAFHLPEEFMKSTEVQAAAQKGFAGYLKSGEINRALEVKNQFNLSETFMESLELKLVAEEGFIKCLGNRTHHSGQIGTQYTHDWKEIEEIKKQFNLSKQFINSPQVMSVLNERLEVRFNHFYYRIKDTSEKREKQNEMKATLKKLGWPDDLVDSIIRS